MSARNAAGARAGALNPAGRSPPRGPAAGRGGPWPVALRDPRKGGAVESDSVVVLRSRARGRRLRRGGGPGGRRPRRRGGRVRKRDDGRSGSDDGNRDRGRRGRRALRGAGHGSQRADRDARRRPASGRAGSIGGALQWPNHERAVADGSLAGLPGSARQRPTRGRGPRGRTSGPGTTRRADFAVRAAGSSPRVRCRSGLRGESAEATAFRRDRSGAPPIWCFTRARHAPIVSAWIVFSSPPSRSPPSSRSPPRPAGPATGRTRAATGPRPRRRAAARAARPRRAPPVAREFYPRRLTRHPIADGCQRRIHPLNH